MIIFEKLQNQKLNLGLMSCVTRILTIFLSWISFKTEIVSSQELFQASFYLRKHLQERVLRKS